MKLEVLRISSGPDSTSGILFEIKDNTDLKTRKPFNKDLFEKLRKEHKV